jgi:hypothetical protein
LSNNEDAEVIDGLGILLKLVQNILKNPTEDKFRVLKKIKQDYSVKVDGIETIWCGH